MMLFLVPTFFLVFSMCVLNNNVRSSVTPRYTGRLQWVRFTPFQLIDVELFATFAITQIKDADLRLCRIRAELVCGIVLRQSD